LWRKNASISNMCNLLWLPDFLLWKLEHQILDVDTNSHYRTSTNNFANNVNTWSNTECITPRRQTFHLQSIGSLKPCYLNMDLINSTQVHNLTTYCISIRSDYPPTSYVDCISSSFTIKFHMLLFLQSHIRIHCIAPCDIHDSNSSDCGNFCLLGCEKRTFVSK
jgi:hypothetical protein